MMAESSPSRARGWVGKAFAATAGLPGRILLAGEGWRERSRLRRELDNLDQKGELDRTLIDSGITRSDVPRLMRAHPRTLEQLAGMMQRLGIDRAALPHTPAVAEALRAMEWRCGACADWRKCRAWLAARDAPESYRAFCPNAAALDALRCGDAAAAGAAPRKPCGLLAELKSAASMGGTEG